MKKLVHRGTTAKDALGPPWQLGVKPGRCSEGRSRTRQSLGRPWVDDGLEMSSLAPGTRVGQNPAKIISGKMLGCRNI
jgi:hypothetical protein